MWSARISPQKDSVLTAERLGSLEDAWPYAGYVDAGRDRNEARLRGFDRVALPVA
jgi:hypothetical protein